MPGVGRKTPQGTGVPHANDLQALIAYSETYVYDKVGNIEQMAHVAGPSGSLGWTRNYQYATTSNRLEKTSVPGSPLNLSETYTYDAHGSMTTMPHLAVMDWDYADRLKHTQKGAGAGAQDTYFTYDAAGQRVRKTNIASGTVKERIYLGGYEVYRERAATAGAPVDFERQTLHVMDDQRRVAMAETKTREAGAVVPTLTTRWRFQLDNHLGSATLEFDDAGSVISYEEYHPYGSTAFHTANGAAQVSVKRYRYTGKEKDDETGLYYHGARYYAPWLGRWTAADPIGITGGLNLYRYSRDNPILFADPGGTEPFAKPSSNDYKVGTSKDPELIGYLQHLSPEQRGNFVDSTTGKFRERAQAALRAGHLGSTTTVPEVAIEGRVPQGEVEQETAGPRPTREQLEDKVPLIPFFIKDYHGGLGWQQYVRADQGVPQGAPRGLRELRALNGGFPLGVAQFSREYAPGTSIESLTLQSVEVTSSAVSALSAATRLAPALTRGALTVTDEALNFGAKSAQEGQKLRNLTKTGEALAERGVDVAVRGEGVSSGELAISLRGGRQVLAESKRLTVASRRAVQSAIEAGTKQSATVVIDGTGAGVTPETFDAAFETFKRVSLQARIAKDAPITSGQVIFLFGENGIRVVTF